MMPDFVQGVEDTCRDVVSNVHTSMPATITAYKNGRVDAQIKGKFYIGGKPYDYPLITNCPFVDGSIGMASPIKVGDECLLIFTEQSLSQWLTGTSTNDNEKWSISNAVAVCGITKVESNAQKRANDSGCIVIDKSVTVDGEVTANGVPLANKAQDHERRIAQLEQQVEQHEQRIAQLEQQVEDLASQVSSLAASADGGD